MMKAEAVESSTLTKNLPEGWRWARLREVCDFNYGSGLPSQLRQEGDVPVYGSNGIVGYHNQALTQGPTIIIGRKGSIGQVHLSQVPCWPIDTTYFIEHPKIDVDLKWLSYWLRALHLDELNKAAAIPGLNRDDAYALKISLPPLAEQQRIVAILNEQIATVQKAKDASETQLEAAKALPSVYLRSVFESSEAQKWPVSHVSQLCDRINYGYTASADFKAREPRFLRITDIQNGSVDWEQVPGCQISPDAEASYTLADGDIVFARTGGTTGKSFLIKSPPRSVFASYLIRLRPRSSSVIPEFLYLFFQSENYWQQIKASMRGGAQPNVNAVLLGGVTLPLPPIPIQVEVVARLNEQMMVMENIRKALEEQLHFISALPAVLLQRAFNGEL